MEWLTPLLPVTVIAAIVLFVVKEAVEGFRRYRTDVRKGRAFRTLLARECELNHWAHKTLKEVLLEIQQNFETEHAEDYTIRRTRSGDVVVQRKRDGRWQRSSTLPTVRTDLMSRVLLDVAILDRSLFTHLEAAYDSAIDMKHVRESFIHLIETGDEFEKGLLEGFVPYGLKELAKIFTDLEKLYRECTGKELKVIRVR